MKYGERLAKDGTVDRADIQQHVVRVDPNQQYQTDTYIPKGIRPGRMARSRFDYHGFQYVEVTGFPGKPTLDTLRGVFIHSAIPVAGEFECSNPLLNKIWRAGPLVLPEQPARHPDGLPASREERLDGRRPPGRRAGPAQLRARRRLYQMDQRPGRRTAPERRAARHRPHQRLGLQMGQRPGVGQRVPAHPVLPLRVLRRHQGPVRPLRGAEALRGLPDEQGQGRHRGHRPERLGARTRPARPRTLPRPPIITATRRSWRWRRA